MKKKKITMGEMYGDETDDHEGCQICGFCKDCGDCQCGKISLKRLKEKLSLFSKTKNRNI